MKKNPFSVLGVPDTASDEQIRNAYRELARKYSDSSDDGKMQELNDAYYLKGAAQQRRGWLDYASENFDRACRMDPNNREYAAAKENLDASKNGGFRSARKSSSGCSACDVCSGLLCADCCCECMGGDLIPCC